MILFIVCLVEFLLFGACATSTFFLITLMVLLDVLAGFHRHHRRFAARTGPELRLGQNREDQGDHQDVQSAGGEGGDDVHGR